MMSNYRKTFRNVRNSARKMKTRARRGMSKISMPTNIYDQYIFSLKRLYPLCKHDTIIEAANYQEHKITYGEMTYEGIEELYTHVLSKTTSPLNSFLDVGCGRGKLCLYMAAKPNVYTSTGIELVKSRLMDAENLKSILSKKYLLYTNKTNFINEDILKLSLSDSINANLKTFVWFSNLCFDPSVTTTIFEKLVSELSTGSIICCSKTPTDNIDRLKKLENVVIPMSWSQSSNVYMYVIE
jgi:SAM-dependent methyltransferase